MYTANSGIYMYKYNTRVFWTLFDVRFCGLTHNFCFFSCFDFIVLVSSVGFPEVKLGILPAAMGTQRFPRVVGLKVAMDMIVSGNPISAQTAFKYGILDQVLSNGLHCFLDNMIFKDDNVIEYDMAIHTFVCDYV